MHGVEKHDRGGKLESWLSGLGNWDLTETPEKRTTKIGTRPRSRSRETTSIVSARRRRGGDDAGGDLEEEATEGV